MTLPSPQGGTHAPDVRVRRARVADLARTARVHLACLPDGFFARLGRRFLARYHESFLRGRRATALVAEVDGEVAGFLVGTTDNADHYRRLLRRPPVRLVVDGVLALLADPRLALAFVRTRGLRYARAFGRRLRPRAAAGAPVAAPHQVAVLTHVAVDDGARGAGAGAALVDRFVDEVRRAGAEEVRLVTPAGGSATRFYRRLGWRSRGVRHGSDGTVVEEFARRP